MEQFSRITHNPAVMGGKPCIRGIRVTVSTVVGLVGDYPYLEREDVLEAIRYAAWK